MGKNYNYIEPCHRFFKDDKVLAHFLVPFCHDILKLRQRSHFADDAP